MNRSCITYTFLEKNEPETINSSRCCYVGVEDNELMGKRIKWGYNRRGSLGDQLMHPALLFILFFIAVFLVGGVVLFYGSDIDVRGIESSQLVARIHECVLSHEFVIGQTVSLEQLAAACRIDAKVLLDAYVLALFKNDVQVLNVGDAVSCDFKGSQNNVYYPRCREERFVFEGARYVIRAGSHQMVQRGLA